MDRGDFKLAVLARDGHLCVVCKGPAVDAHHILERRLWADGGYIPENGVSLCSECHLKAERTEISPKELRELAHLKIVVPPHMEIDEEYDKWGNVYMQSGQRAPGELFWDESVQKILKDCLDEFSPYIKYPRTLHLPYSPGRSDDDRTMKEIPFVGEEVVITEKLDGENTTLYRDHIHARSIDSKGHPSRSWVKNLHAKIAYDIPQGMRICGENLQAQHAIAYKNLPGYFLVFSIWEGSRCFSWDETIEWASLFDLPLVPVLFRGIWDGEPIDPKGAYGDIEGYVARVARSFSLREFRSSVGKYVRAGHINESTQHWFARPIVPNRLA